MIKESPDKVKIDTSNGVKLFEYNDPDSFTILVTKDGEVLSWESEPDQDAEWFPSHEDMYYNVYIENGGDPKSPVVFARLWNTSFELDGVQIRHVLSFWNVKEHYSSIPLAQPATNDILSIVDKFELDPSVTLVELANREFKTVNEINQGDQFAKQTNTEWMMHLQAGLRG